MGGVQTLSWKGHSHIGGACVGMLALKTQMKFKILIWFIVLQEEGKKKPSQLRWKVMKIKMVFEDGAKVQLENIP